MKHWKNCGRMRKKFYQNHQGKQSQTDCSQPLQPILVISLGLQGILFSFGVIVNGLVSLVYLSDSQCTEMEQISIRFVSCSLTEFIDELSCQQFSGGIFRVFMSFVNSDSFTSFPIQIPCISFSCLLAAARTSNTMLNKSGEWAPLSCS